ncbi:AfsR/SARP family transcriptional regulator [Saccharopolyspora erythraea]|uniref:Transcriptional regulator n=2 Tax=Saccharopolyspora erythraea TaxID=1836 RepID=A4FI72_SACEN|nr:BTAD domain-containing putative transcriptional regulator [Saccharopolyspora erythraea]QRK87607.1 winged helix-turn-helix domain-containing protein [Saccharopolyspora erythraea]CAM03747.1 transcriptional regulator [Saccharopolyspora erythraea NRRL 2338]
MMRFRLLGPIEAEDSRGLVPLGGTRQRTLLAALLLDAGRPVDIARLVDAVWPNDPPATVRTQLQICVSGLRRQLRMPIRSNHGGYTLEVDASTIDSVRFEVLIREARQAMSEHRSGSAVKAFRAALDLWRGSALQGAPGLAAEAARLEELRLTATEQMIDAELDLGHHTQVLGELSVLVRENPLHERFHAQLMLALYRSSRQAEALNVFQDLRSVLDHDLGLEPGPAIQALHQRILVRDSTLDLPASGTDGPPHLPGEQPPQPAEPAQVVPLAGRKREVRHVAELLSRGGPPAVVVLTGQPGVGKSAVATGVAHELRGVFPDGVAHLDGEALGDDGEHYPNAVGTLLRQLGMPRAQLPRDAASRYRYLHGKLRSTRALLVFDDVTDESRVRRLVPDSALCSVLITSRDRVWTLPRCEVVELAPLDLDTSLELLSNAIGPDRVAEAPEDARQIALSCAGFPFALHIAASRLRSNPNLTLARSAHECQTKARKIGALAGCNPDVLRAFADGYKAINGTKNVVEPAPNPGPADEVPNARPAEPTAQGTERRRAAPVQRIPENTSPPGRPAHAVQAY